MAGYLALLSPGKGNQYTHSTVYFCRVAPMVGKKDQTRKQIMDAAYILNRPGFVGGSRS
jgi:hypothetical protein